MKLAADLVLTSLGPLVRAVLQDPAVVAVHIHGPGHVFVERDDGTVIRGPTIDAASLETTANQVRRATQSPSPAITALLEPGGSVTLIDAPAGAILTIESGAAPSLTLDALASPALLPVLRAMVTAKLSVLVVGPDRRARNGLMTAWLASVPGTPRIVVVDEGNAVPLRQAHVLHVPIVDSRAVAVASVMGALPSLRSEWLCLPDITLGGASALQAACACTATIAGCAASDGEGALALLSVGHVTSSALAAGAFRAVLEMGSINGRPRVTALREHNRLPDGRTLLATLYSARGDASFSAPSFAHRLDLERPPWTERAQISVVTEPPVNVTDPDRVLPVPEPVSAITMRPEEFTPEVLAPARTPRASDQRAEFHAAMSPPATPQDWEDDTSTSVSTPRAPENPFAVPTNPSVNLPPALQGGPTAQVEVPAIARAAAAATVEDEGVLTLDEPAKPRLPPPPPFREAPSFRAAPQKTPPPRRPLPPPRPAPTRPLPSSRHEPEEPVDLDSMEIEETSDVNSSGVFAKAADVLDAGDDEG